VTQGAVYDGSVLHGMETADSQTDTYAEDRFWDSWPTSLTRLEFIAMFFSTGLSIDYSNSVLDQLYVYEAEDSVEEQWLHYYKEMMCTQLDCDDEDEALSLSEITIAYLVREYKLYRHRSRTERRIERKNVNSVRNRRTLEANNTCSLIAHNMKDTKGSDMETEGIEICGVYNAIDNGAKKSVVTSKIRARTHIRKRSRRHVAKSNYVTTVRIIDINPQLDTERLVSVRKPATRDRVGRMRL